VPGAVCRTDARKDLPAHYPDSYGWPQPILRSRDVHMSEKFMDLLIAERFAKATCTRKKQTVRPADHLRNAWFSEIRREKDFGWRRLHQTGP
jgi:hypothetical protein